MMKILLRLVYAVGLVAIGGCTELGARRQVTSPAPMAFDRAVGVVSNLCTTHCSHFTIDADKQFTNLFSVIGKCKRELAEVDVEGIFDNALVKNGWRACHDEGYDSFDGHSFRLLISRDKPEYRRPNSMPDGVSKDIIPPSPPKD